MGKQARQRKEKAENTIKLAQPDRSAPSEKTLLQFAHERNLFDQADNDPRNKNRPKKVDDSDDDEEDDNPVISPNAERILDTVLWVVSLTMVHFTFDYLVQYQYGIEMDIGAVGQRTGRACLLFLFLFWFLHEHRANPILVPGLPLKYQTYVRQTIFTLMSVISGCTIIYLTNEYGYLAVLKRAPTLGCLWLWSVIELPLMPATGSLLVSAAFLWLGGYTIE
ncbi:hypothetical protein F5X68DRAFT_189559 [Plectosphaerella plurivora]|uniref:DUF7719 domain-containing protein n=1 Tax=Plectosphaerella plurivora TaxID=936078 RepID=A0A9P8VH46_9PEZI|nr:hypothetical protein F5X68DRAFT_189559 [Plectosphaerella plurivora]